MPKTCSVCVHPERDAIEEAVLNAKGQRTIAGLFDISRGALRRHTEAHLRPVLQEIASGEIVTPRAMRLVDRMQHLDDITDRVLGDAVAVGNGPLALAAVREARANLAIRADIAGPTDTTPPGVEIARLILANDEARDLVCRLEEVIAPYDPSKPIP